MKYLLDQLHHVQNWLLVGTAILLGHAGGKIAGLVRLPSVVGYLLVGVLLGNLVGLITGNPSHNPVSPECGQTLELVTDFGLGIVAFVIGSELSGRLLKRTGRQLSAILFGQFFGAVFMVVGAVWLMGVLTSGTSFPLLPAGIPPLPAALVFGALAAATAPAGTVAVVQEYKAKGPVTRMLLAVVGLDDGLAIMVYAFAATAAKALLSGQKLSPGPALGRPAFEILGSLVLGGLAGLLLSFVVKRTRNRVEILTLTLGAVLLVTGICNINFAGVFSSAAGGQETNGHPLHLSMILANLAVGMAVVNVSAREGERTATALGQITHPVYVLFFVVAGAHLNLKVLAAAGVLMPVYILCRSAGKMGGSWLGALATRSDANTRRYLGLGLLPQAGVAIGLALMISHEFADLAGPHAEAAAQLGSLVISTIAATTMFFEIIGPIAAKIALQKSGEITVQKDGDKAGERK
jgi:Kef-type K+ transport system membrane component KefB